MNIKVYCHHLLLAALLFLCSGTVKASLYYDVYYDPETTAMIVASMGAQLLQEQQAGEYLDHIFKAYGKATIAATGIFAIKNLERKALHDAGVFAAAESYYYQYIYKLVYERIIPQILRDAILLVDHLDQAYFWIPRIAVVCEDVRKLCEQFSAVVSNGKLSFGFDFPQFKEEILKMVGFDELSAVNWRELFDDLSHIDLDKAGYTLESFGDSVISQLNDVYKSGASLFGSGTDAAGGILDDKKSVLNVFKGKPTELVKRLDSLKVHLDSIVSSHGVHAKMKDFLGKIDSATILTQLFDYKHIDPAALIADFSQDGEKKYYRQRWYIAGETVFGETICDYTPPFDKSSDLWAVSFKTWGFTKEVTDEELAEVRKKVETACGWSQEKVDEMNASDDGYTYSFSIEPVTKTVEGGMIAGVTTIYYFQSYHIVVKRGKSDTAVLYEEVYDSYDMDYDAFMIKMQAKLDMYKNASSESGLDSSSYELKSDPPEYYDQDESLHLQGMSQAVFTVYCDDGGALSEGTEVFKINRHGANPLEDNGCPAGMPGGKHDGGKHDSKCDAMETHLEEADTSDKDYANNQISHWAAEYGKYCVEYGELTNQINEYSYAASMGTYEVDGIPIADYINGLVAERDAVGEQRDAAKDSLNLWAGLMDEILEDLADDGDVFRIPHIMNMYEGLFELEWLEDGHWEGFTWVRKCLVTSVNREAVLRVSLRKVKGEVYFIVRIHRAQMALDYGLYYDSASENVVEYLDLDKSKTDEENQAIIDEHLAKWQEDYPLCTVDYELRKQDDLNDSITDHHVHLLWPGDRLQIARDICNRLGLILARLQVIERELRAMKTLSGKISGALYDITHPSFDKAWGMLLLEERRARLKSSYTPKTSSGSKPSGAPPVPLPDEKKPKLPSP